MEQNIPLRAEQEAKSPGPLRPCLVDAAESAKAAWMTGTQLVE